MNHPPLPAAPPGPADPLDAWLRRGLGRRFGAAVDEPVPERLSRLIEEAHVGRGRRAVAGSGRAAVPEGGESAD